MDNPIPEAEPRHVVEVLQEGAGEEEEAAEHHVGPSVDTAIGKCSNEKVTTQHHIQDACHEQLNQLGSIDDLATKPLAKDLLGHLIVAVPDLDNVPKLVLLVEALDEDLASVAAYVGDAHHGEYGPVTTMIHGIGQGHDEHTL